MDLRSPHPFWLLKHGIIRSYPSLHTDTRADVVVIGAGISGALVANRLCEAGFDTIVVDRRHAATGSTAASTALLQYEIDVPLRELIPQVGREAAVRSYRLCLESIGELGSICRRLPETGLFVEKPSLQYASYKKDEAPLREEYRIRKKIGIDLAWLTEKDIRQRFGFEKAGALLSSAGAEADAYRITHSLLKKNIAKGLRVFDNTDVTDIQHKHRSVTLTTDAGIKIEAKRLVIACGYESQQYLPITVQRLHSTYAIVSEPCHQKHFWYKNALIWETAKPYLYLRTTTDHRILMGGKDSLITSPVRRDAMVTAKAKALEKSFSDLFPGIPLKTDFKWTGNFASTRDGLPFIGSVRQRPHTWFALGFGGNGITFSVIAANIIRDLIMGKKNENSQLFRFDR